MKIVFGARVRKLLTLCMLFTSSLALAADKVGIVLMHGKRGSPEYLQPLADKLSRQGYLVITPEMPWSASRAYDRPLEESHQEIDAAIESLRLQGVNSLVVAGHSMGANMAIGYAATHPGIDAVMALGPGQTVESQNFRDALGSSVAEARKRVLAGKGGESVELTDLHLGKTSRIEVAASIYLSYFDPDGLANMPKSATRISIPFLWTVGARDKNMLDRGAAYAFGRSVAHPLNRYAVVEADHMGTPVASEKEVIEWLSSVFPETPQPQHQ